MDVLGQDELPPGMRYPGAFLRLVGRGLTQFEPWWVLDGEHLRNHLRGLKERYPKRTLIPFARREDNDDIACWEDGRGDQVVIIHDYAEIGREERRLYPSFYDWLRQALEDMIEFDQFEDDG